MRPLRLEMHAFGPYPRTQKLDFRELGDRPLFLIHGPTGSGKSTILDAICFALYGETSGKERDGTQMRSDHAAPDAKTRVVYDFTLRDQVYRIDRTPKYEVPIGEGERPRTHSASASLWRLATPDDLDEDGELLASGVSSVRENVERLLGLRPDQFRQVVVLPQGKFRELLTADSKKRGEIFSTLFQTYHYRFIQERLKERAKSIRDELDDKHNHQRHVLEMAAVDDEEALNEKIVEVEKNLAELGEERKKKETAAVTARKQRDEARETDRLLNERDEAGKALRSLQERQEEIDTVRKNVERARKAAQLVDLEGIVNTRLEEARTSESTRDQIAEKKDELEQQLKTAESTLEAADARKPEIEQARAEFNRLESLRPRIEDLGGAATALRKAESLVAERERELNEAREAHDRLTGELTEKQGKLGSAQIQASHLQGYQFQVNDLKRQLTQRKKLDTDRGYLATAIDEQDTAANAVEIAQARLDDAGQSYERLDSAWRHGQAAVLAGDLVEGEPCPVCGSVHHPSPATSEDEVPDEQQVDQARRDFEQAQSNLNTAEQDKFKADQNVKQLNEQIEQLQTELQDAADQRVDEIERAVSDAEKSLRAASEAAETVGGLGTEVEELGEAVKESESVIEKLRGASTETQSSLSSAKTRYETAEKEVPENLRSIEALDAEIKAQRETAETVQQKIDDARASRDRIKGEFQSNTASLAAAEREAERDRRTASEQEAEFARRRLQQGFADDQEYHAAKLDEEEIAERDRWVREFDNDLTVATDRFKTAEKRAEGLEWPDLEALEQAVTVAEGALQSVIESIGTRTSELESLKRAREQLAKVAEEIESLERDYSVAEYLSGVANGEAKYNRYRINFENFVLGTFLDDVLVVATDKLRKMTNGRFHLHRKLEGSDRRRSTGLDLEVLDAYTGTSRDVSTLSGGEGFLAALALALGLSEVVQSRSGGIRLDTLFVDEGFGSLDPDALDRSLNTLIDLHKGRLVGIISHVPELQERIDARLSVTARREGSVAQFVV